VSFSKNPRRAKKKQKERLRRIHFNCGLRPQTHNIRLTSNPGTTNIHIENLQINLNMGNATNVNGVTIEERIKALRDALKPKNGTG
jgi:hypothetical protein